MWEDDGLSQRFSADAFQVLLLLIGSGDDDSALEGLENLSETLAYANEDLLGDFPISEMCLGMIKLLETSPNPHIQESAALCIFQFLEAHSASTRNLVSNNILGVMKLRLEDPTIVGNVITNILRALEVISEFRPSEIGQVVGLSPIALKFPTLRLIEQRSAAHIFRNVTQNIILDEFGSSITAIINFLQSHDQRIRDNLISSLFSICSNIDPSKIPLECVPILALELNTCTNGAQIYILLQILQAICKTKELAEAIISGDFNFSRFLTSNDTEIIQPNALQVKLTISILSNLLPKCGLPKTLKHNSFNAKNGKELASVIAPSIFHVLLEHADIDFNTIIVLASISVSKIEIPPPIIHLLVGLAQDPSLAPYCLCAAMTLHRNPVLARTNIIKVLKETSSQISEPAQSWYSKCLKNLEDQIGNLEKKPFKPEEFKTFPEFLQFIKTEEITPYELITPNFPSEILNLINNHDFNSNFQLNLNSNLELDYFIKLLNELLFFFPLEKPIEMYGVSPSSFLQRQILVSMDIDGNKHQHEMGSESNMIDLEGWFNTGPLNISDTTVLTSHRSSDLKNLVSIDAPNELTYEELGIWHRLLHTPKYQRFNFKINGITVSPYESVLSLVCRHLYNNSTYSGGKEIPVTLELQLVQPENSKDFKIDTEMQQKSQINPNSNLDLLNPKLKSILDLLKLLDFKLNGFNYNFKSEAFEKKLNQTLKLPFASISHFSQAIPITINYPFLFSMGFRTRIFKTCCFSIRPLLEFLKSNGEQFASRKPRAKVSIDREKVFEEGLYLIKTILTTPLPLDLSFKGEEGIGQGPTQEFFTLMGQEFCKKKLNLWRNGSNCTNNMDSDYAWAEKGLYPKPDADLNLLESLGILCGSAVQMGNSILIPFSLTFFKALLLLDQGQDKNLKQLKIIEIDEILANSLANPSGLEGLPFVYPGTNIKLTDKENEIEVNSSNLNEFILKIEEKTRAIEQIKAFKKGLEVHLSPGVWNLLNEKELRELICGTQVNLTNDDLKKYIQFTHGYNVSSPQVEMLFNVLLELDSREKSLFFKFVTGCETLPIGGLKALAPPLTVARRTTDHKADDCLPTVMTCMNYFKLPPYSTKDIMKQKLVYAISEGQGCFLLS